MIYTLEQVQGFDRALFPPENKIRFHQDFAVWEGIPPDLVFYRLPEGKMPWDKDQHGQVNLVARGFGLENEYGNGSIFLNKEIFERHRMILECHLRLGGEMTDLAQRLRELAMNKHDDHNLAADAADRIEALEEQLKTSRGLRASQHAIIEAQTQRIIALEAALREMIIVQEDGGGANAFETALRNARRALEGK